MTTSSSGTSSTPTVPSVSFLSTIRTPQLPANPRHNDYKLFIRQLKNYFTIAQVDSTFQLPVLLNCLGGDGLDIYDGLPEPKATFADAETRLDEYFCGKSSLLLRRKEFFQSKQEINETVTEFSCRLRRLAKDCNFGVSLQDMLRDIFVIGVHNDRLGERLLSEDAMTLTFDLALTKAEAFERACKERRSVGTVSRVQEPPAASRFQEPKSISKPSTQAFKSNKSKNKSTVQFAGAESSKRNWKEPRRCYRCDSADHLASSYMCPARNKICESCGKRGHFLKVCRSNKIASMLSDEPEDSSAVHVFASLNAVTRLVKINDVVVKAICDTGASVNVIPKEVLPSSIDVLPSSTTVKAWGNFNISVLGYCICSVQYGTCKVDARFEVVDVTGCETLLTYDLCLRLGIIAELAQVSKSCPVKSNNTDVDDNCEILLKQYDYLFNKQGLLTTGYKYSISLTDKSASFSTPARRVPVALYDKVKAEIDRMESMGVIRKVEEPTQFCSPMIVVFKPSGDLRICADLRELNKFVKREHLQLPTFSELASRVANPVVFSHLDCRNGFWQIPVEESSQQYLTFSTPFGRYCYTRLCFGISSAPEIYSRIMNDVVGDIPNVFTYIDDIFIAAKSKEEHDKALKIVFERLDRAGLALNKNKCVFSEPSVSFLGHTWSSEGVEPNASKIEAIQNIALPKSHQALRSFLGLVSYIGQRFVPHYSTLAKGLWDMLSDKELKWSEKNKNCFHELKRAIQNVSKLAYFDPKLETVVQTDASGIGLGAVIIQNERPVAYISRTLTPIEQRYSQIERECLSIIFAVTRLKQYLTGINFVLTTDHKPLLQIFQKPIDKLSSRLQRWVLSIQHFTFQLQHIAGEENLLADALSRNSVSGDHDRTPEEIAEFTICALSNALPLNLATVAKETIEDDELIEISNAISKGWDSISCKKLLPYYHLRDQLSLRFVGNNKLICNAGKVVIPRSMRTQLLTVVHEGHAGINKMKSMIRSYAYWPQMTQDIVDFVQKCSPCIIHQKRGDNAPLQQVAETVEKPWSKISIDLTGPSEALEGNVLLTMIDLHSRFPEVEVLRRSRSSDIIESLAKQFARYGIPDTLISDNGTPFVSNEFESFLSSNGIVHIYSSNYYPRGNSVVERLHGTLKLRLAKIMETKNDFRESLNIVLRDIRSTPNEVTGETPFYKFFGRSMKTKLSRLAITDDLRPTCCKRNIVSEYSKRGGCKKSYNAGDTVFLRKGDKTCFKTVGVVSKQIGPFTYEVNIDGYIRKYNQRHMKPAGSTIINPNYAYEDAHDAYNEVLPRTCTSNSTNSNSTSSSTPTHTYNLRPRNRKNYRV